MGQQREEINRTNTVSTVQYSRLYSSVQQVPASSVPAWSTTWTHTSLICTRQETLLFLELSNYFLSLIGRIFCWGAMGRAGGGWRRSSDKWWQLPRRRFRCRRRNCYCWWGNWRYYWGIEYRTIRDFGGNFMKIFPENNYYFATIYLIL